MEVNIEALTQLRRVVTEAPDHQFHMRSFREKSATCGTAYCAAGWATQDPWFIVHRFMDIETLMDSRKILGDDRLADYFGITHYDAKDLFGYNLCSFHGPHGVKKEEVIQNIDRLLSGRRAEPYEILYDNGD